MYSGPWEPQAAKDAAIADDRKWLAELKTSSNGVLESQLRITRLIGPRWQAVAIGRELESRRKR